MKGLEDVVKIVYVHPIQAHIGGDQQKRTWVFSGVSEDRPLVLISALEAMEKKDPAEIDDVLKKWMYDINSANSNQFGLDMVDPWAIVLPRSSTRCRCNI
jgi:hypothetical protein